jgi:eukaryotic-like serine/threonine-protein kinase
MYVVRVLVILALACPASASGTLGCTVEPGYDCLPNREVNLLPTRTAGSQTGDSKRQTKWTDKDTIVLADFTNSTGIEVFNGTLEQPLRTALEESPFLSVTSGFNVAAILRDMKQPASAALTPELARAVCQRINSRAYIKASIDRSGSEFVIELQAVDSGTGKLLTEVQSTAPSKEKVLDVLGETAAKLRVHLGESPESVREFGTPLSRATSGSFEALRAWEAAIRAQQEHVDLVEGSQAALPLLEKAVKLDPEFASAIFTIGMIYRDALQESRAGEYLTRAFTLGERSSVREKFRNAGMYYSFVTVQYEKAVEMYGAWIKAYPRDERPVSNFGSFYGDVCRYQEAIAQFIKARRMNPSNVIPHEDLIELLAATGQFDKAWEAYREMQRMKLDDDGPHVYLYAVAFLQHDSKEMAEQAGWFDGKPQVQHELLSEQADAEAYTGHLARAREITRQAVESGLRADNKEQAAAWELNSAWREELFGNKREAREQAVRALEIAPESREEGAVAAILLGRAGDTARANAIADDLAKRYPLHAVVQTYWLPCIRAQLSLVNKQPAVALKQLEKAEPYDILFPQVAFYSPMLSVVLRAEAYMALGRPDAAEKEWRKILQHPGIVQLSATAPISHLQLARALAVQARTNNSSVRARARMAYQDFLSLWKDADATIPILKEAEGEFAALQ